MPCSGMISLHPLPPSTYSQVPTALPYMGAYLDQIYTLEMGSPTYNANGLVNFAKMTKVSYSLVMRLI